MTNQVPGPTIQTEDDLLRLIGTEESLYVEFTASAALEGRSWLKDVAAFATAEGGRLAIGILELKGKGRPHVADRIDAGLESTHWNKERLENLIAGNVRPRVEGVQVTSIPLTASEAPPGNLAFAVEVPASPTAPHMFECAYYMRHGSLSLPMDDYLVRAVMMRPVTPELHLVPTFPDVSGGTQLHFEIENVGNAGAENVYLEVELPRGAVDPNWTPRGSPPVIQHWYLEGPEGPRVVFSYMQTDAPTRTGGGPEIKRLPPIIFPRARFKIHDFVIALRSPIDPGAMMVTRLYARNMPVVVQNTQLGTSMSGVTS